MHLGWVYYLFLLLLLLLLLLIIIIIIIYLLQQLTLRLVIKHTSLVDNIWQYNYDC